VLTLLLEDARNTAFGTATNAPPRPLLGPGVLSGGALPLLLSLMLQSRARFSAPRAPTAHDSVAVAHAIAAAATQEMRPDELCAQLLDCASMSPPGAAALHAALLLRPDYRRVLLTWLFDTLCACDFRNRGACVQLLALLR
jgi:hypothetical protein